MLSLARSVDEHCAYSARIRLSVKINDEYKEYKAVADFADNIGVCAWRNDKKGIFFATKVEQIKDFMKSRRKANEAGNAG